MSSSSFAHLHTHSDHSLLDGLSKVQDLVRRAEADGQPALAITDHGNLHAAVELFEATAQSPVKPIAGMEAYLDPGEQQSLGLPTSRDEQEDGKKKERWHLLLLATNETGWRNLCKIATAAQLDHMVKGYPHVTMDLLANHSDGLVVTTACVGGIVPQLLLEDNEEAAKRWLIAFGDIFGRDRTCIEIQHHNLPFYDDLNRRLVSLSRRGRFPLIASQDSHYLDASDAKAHEAWLCVQTRRTLADPKRWRFEGSDYHFATAAEMRRKFAELPEACDGTLALAESVERFDPFSSPRMPRFATPPGVSEESMLRELVARGSVRRFGDPVPRHIADRLDYELGVICDAGFAGYFLVVRDLVRAAMERGVTVGPGRGSAAGSAVAYSLGITSIDPIANGLAFERFLNPARAKKGTLPDIDLDFADTKRHEIISYARERYGADKVAALCTFTTLHAKLAIRDACRVLDLPYSLGQDLSSRIPEPIMGRAPSLAACLEQGVDERFYTEAADLRTYLAGNANAQKVVDMARRLEGTIRAVSVHAAGVVISDRPLVDTMALMRTPGKKDTESDVGDLAVLQCDLHGAERLGLVKFDFLGLRTLSVLKHARELVVATTGTCPTPRQIPLDDPEAYRLLSQGRSTGVFQLDAPPVRRLLARVQPKELGDVAAITALWRPGPMGQGLVESFVEARQGHELPPEKLIHPDMKRLCAETEGLLVYQEQLMALVSHFAGMNAAEADEVRRACGKKDPRLMAQMRDRFIEGCIAQGHSAELAKQLFEAIIPFSDYAFNKAHAYSYAAVGVQCAWMKAHYPEAFWAAQFESVKSSYDDLTRLIGEARDEGVRIIGPDVNRSQAGFSVETANDIRAVRFGLAGVRGVGTELSEAIVEYRQDAPYRSMIDFARRLMSKLRQDTLVALIDAGALDAFGVRSEMRTEAPKLLQRMRRKTAPSLFDVAPVEQPMSTAQRLSLEDLEYERHALGVYLSAHPLDCTPGAHGMDPGDARRLAEEGHQQRVSVIGVVEEPQLLNSKSGVPRTKAMLDGKRGRLPVVAFKELAPHLQAAAGKVVRTQVGIRKDERYGVEAIVNDLVTLETSAMQL